MGYNYDTNNIFAKILRGEIPNTTVLETEHSLAFRDLHPQAPEHVLVIPKGPYVNYDHFATDASEPEIIDFTRAVAQVAQDLGLKPDGTGAGYRLISNAGENGMQEVPHLHIHLLAGRKLGPIVTPLKP